MSGLCPRISGSQTALDEGDPFPPEDVLTRDRLMAELERLYRDRAAPLAERLGKHGAAPDERLDLIHEAFTRMLGRSTARQLLTECPEAYVARISRNLLNDRGRAKAIRNRWVDEVTSDGAHHDQIIYLESRDRLRRIEAAVAKLKPITREIFLARRVDGLSYAEIAVQNGMSVRSVERHMSKAIAKLSRLMDRA